MSRKIKKHSGDYVDYEIKPLRATKAVRFRPAMYLGSNDSRALHTLVDLLLVDGLGEYLAATASLIDVRLCRDGSLIYQTNGGGCSLEPIGEESQKTRFESEFTDLFAGSYRPWWSRNKRHVQYRSAGLHGDLGFVCVNAVSEWLLATNYRNGFVWTLQFQKGELISPLKQRHHTNSTGLSIHFKPDAEILTDITFDYEWIRNRMLELSYLVPGIEMRLRDDRLGSDETFHNPAGLVSFIQHQNRDLGSLFSDVITHTEDIEDLRRHYGIEIALQPTTGFDSHLHYFVNGEPCRKGTHVKGFQEGLYQALNTYGTQHGLFWREAPSLEDYLEGLTGVLAVWTEYASFQDQKKTELLNPELEESVARTVKEAIGKFAEQRPDCVQQMIEKAVMSAERDWGETLF